MQQDLEQKRQDTKSSRKGKVLLIPIVAKPRLSRDLQSWYVTTHLWNIGQRHCTAMTRNLRKSLHVI